MTYYNGAYRAGLLSTQPGLLRLRPIVPKADVRTYGQPTATRQSQPLSGSPTLP